MARLVLCNTIAYACGALNSFVCNRYWTFRRTGRPKARCFTRFLMMILAAIACNDLLLWFMSKIVYPVYLNLTLWTNISKVAAIGASVGIDAHRNFFISYRRLLPLQDNLMYTS